MNVAGTWTLTQSNGFKVTFDMAQDRDGSLRGSATQQNGFQAGGAGRLDGDSFVFTVDWKNDGAGGRYVGRFDPEGHLSGTTFDVAHPESQATWFTNAFDNKPHLTGNIDG